MNLTLRRPHHHGQRHIWDVIVHKTVDFVRANTVFCIALLLAAVTSCIIPPDAQYLEYPDLKTLTCLFCTLAVICALRNIRFFTILARRIVMLTGNSRAAILALVYITFLGSMLIANDMALLTFLPLGYFVLSTTGKEKYMAFTFVMQNIAANLGGMLTPFGNPQNLYLFSHFQIPTGEFMSIMAVPFAVAILLITLCCLIFVRREELTLEKQEEKKLPPMRTAFYLVLFAYAILIVFRTVPYWTGLIIIPICLLFADRDALKKVDYGLLGTFVCFFVFAGNMSRMESVRALFSALLEKNTLLVSTFSCQFISNVPSAILLSQFTENYRELLWGVNIGGAGTMIASLASLITFREYTQHNPGGTGRYMKVFSALNFGFLGILTAVCLFLR
ncbi:MAG: citrate transporter [Clostridia bacterium]|nr:citrate transporter [Clostridia bacterium]